MKKFLLLWAAAALALIAVPLSVLGLPEKGTTGNGAGKTGTIYDRETDTVRVYDEAAGETVTMPLRDYVIGATAGEMPAAYEFEALCAQALCSRTLAVYLSGYYAADGSVKALSTDPAKHQAYMSKEEMQAKWGEDFDKYYEKLCRAADETDGLLITYEGRPAMTVFHAISPGKTEKAENVWRGALPYLSGADSPWDKDAPGFSSVLTVGEDELCKKLGVKKQKEELIGEVRQSEAGTVLSVGIGGKEFTGLEIRRALGLRSAVFTVSRDGDAYTFSVSGYGHGVGMSQYGAQQLAKEGKSREEIIAWYFPGTMLTRTAGNDE